MIISLLVLGAPYSSQSAHTSLRFCKAAVDTGHTIYRVFFYHDGVNAGNELTTPPQDESNITVLWKDLANTHNLDLVVCVSSALKRGILDSSESERYEKSASNLSSPFEISGLGQLIDAADYSDRLVTFGP